MRIFDPCPITPIPASRHNSNSNFPLLVTFFFVVLILCTQKIFYSSPLITRNQQFPYSRLPRVPPPSFERSFSDFPPLHGLSPSWLPFLLHPYRATAVLLFLLSCCTMHHPWSRIVVFQILVGFPPFSSRVECHAGFLKKFSPSLGHCVHIPVHHLFVATC